MKRQPGKIICYSGKARNEGFTLIELLVVSGILFILFGLSIAASVKGKELAKRSGCLSNLRQIGIATLIYVDENGSYPPAWVDSTKRWMDLIKPYVSKKSNVYICPSDKKKLSVVWDPEIFLSYGYNVFRFSDQEKCFWYGVKAQTVLRPSGVIIFSDCTPGKYYCGGGSVFKEPVTDVDYRHLKKSFVAAFCDGHTEAKTKTQQIEWDVSK